MKSNKSLAILEHHRAVFQEYLQAYCDTRHSRATQLDTAIRYALLSNGKRVRPLLLTLSTQALGGELHMALRPALAIELLHTWSLVHDDLPCMDDDDLRRGQATVHKKFGAADALLAGDALLSDAFYLLHAELRLTATEKLAPVPTRVRLATLFARAVGSRGMVAGQHRDLHAQRLTRAELCAVHRAKSGWLIAAACGAGAIIASSAPVLQLLRLGLRVGLVFQISDDLIDGERQGASWLATMSAAQARAEIERQMARVRHSLQQLRVADSAWAQYLEALASRTR